MGPARTAVLAFRDRRIDLEHTLVMGVLNLTPDSFSDGGRDVDEAAAIARGRALAAAGADVVDVGGESTRPGATPLEAREETARILGVVRALAAETVVSVDTYHAATAAAALEAGAAVVNDVTGGTAEPALLEVVAGAGAALVLGHLRGPLRAMQERIAFQDVVGEVGAELAGAVARAVAAGVPRERIWVDPGIGFGKTWEQNLLLVRAAGAIGAACGGRPVLMGPSRKGFLGGITGRPAAARDAATHAAVAAAILGGASGVRVHDVAGGVDAARVADALVRGRLGSAAPEGPPP